MDDKEAVSGTIRNLESIYNELPADFTDLTFKHMMTVPQKEVKPAMEPIGVHKEKTKQSPGPEKPGSTYSASSLEGSRSGQDHSRKADAEIKRERLARNMGSESKMMAMPSPLEARTEQRRRRGNPHTNICALCDSFIHIFRHRCLVCGRVYCKHCVVTGMGEMAEGRKCIECLGRRFSQRYIERAGKSGCCHGYPSEVKRQELIWAEKGASSTSTTEEKYERNGVRMKEKCEQSRLEFISNNPVMAGTPRINRAPAFIITSTAAFNSSHGISLEER